jgi:hypothetical protein
MKKSLLPILLLIMLIISACSKDGFMPGNDFKHHYSDDFPVMGFTPGLIKVSPVIGDNTQIILDAFEKAKEYGEGAIIQLEEGIYNLRFIEVFEFSGTIMGAGKGKTIIKPIIGLPCLAELSKNRTWLISLVSFIGGNIKLSDLTFISDDGKACDEDYLIFGSDLYVMVKFTDRLHESYAPESAYIKASVENVDFIAGKDDGTGFGYKSNVCNAIWFGLDVRAPRADTDRRTNGNLLIRNCRFEGYLSALDAPCMGGGNITIINNVFNGNYVPLYIYDNLNTDGFISGNSFTNTIFYDMYIDNTEMGDVFGYYPITTPTRRSVFRISKNSFNTSNSGETFQNPSGVSMYLFDKRTSQYPEENMQMKFFVENNSIHLCEGATGIVGINNRDAMIIANKFSGKGTTGISMNGDTNAGIFSSQLKLLGNDFSGASYTEADIILGTNTMNCLVAGSPKDIIVNMGSNNKITGMQP